MRRILEMSDTPGNILTGVILTEKDTAGNVLMEERESGIEIEGEYETD